MIKSIYEKKCVLLRHEIRKELMDIHNAYFEEKINDDPNYAINLLEFCYSKNEELVEKFGPIHLIALRFEGAGERICDLSSRQEYKEYLKIKKELEATKRAVLNK